MANEDKATRYHRLQRRAAVASTALSALLFLWLLVSGGSASLRDVVQRVTGGAFVTTVTGYIVAIAALQWVLDIPLAFYRGVVLERRYGLSTQSAAGWLRDQVKGAALGLVFAVGGGLIVWSLIAWRPGDWWLWAAATFIALLVLLAQIAPVVLLPIFYDFKPLDRPALVDRLMALANRAGARVLGVFEWRLSDRTRKANAALTGMGRTRRILLSDTLLAGHSDDEIEVILAHELAHHVHRDLWSAVIVEAVLVTAGFFVADRVLAVVAGSFGLEGKADIAMLPALVLAAGGVSLLLVPLANALSRSHERRADRYALEMTGNVDAFTTAMTRLAAQNLAEEEPSKLVEVLFHTHPPMRARVAAAQEWARRRETAKALE